jgi:hypothetical protein
LKPAKKKGGKKTGLTPVVVAGTLLGGGGDTAKGLKTI